MIRAVLLCLVPCTCFAQGIWLKARSGPFELFSDAGHRSAGITLADFEQFRFALGQTLGKPDLIIDSGVRILLFKTAKEMQAAGASESLVRARDRFAITAAADRGIPPRVFRDCTRMFIERNVARLPADIEEGLEEFFSTIEIKGAHVIWGAPPSPERRSRNWARIQLLATSPDYYGKLHVILFNLQKGIEPDVAYRNAIGKTARELEAQLDGYMKAGVFAAADGPSRPINPERDLATNPMDNDTLQLALADLLNDRSAAAYEAMLAEKSHVAEANEGLALLAVRRKDAAAARDYLTRSMEAGSKNASTLVAYARMENDPAKSKAALEKAVQFDPNSAEAHFLLGEKLTDLRLRAQQWMAATRLAPQNAEWWAALAKCWLDQQQYGEAAKAWRAAEQSATTDSEREKMHAGRMAVEGQRLDYEESERKRIADERAREIQRLKAKAIADLRAAEAKANGAPLPDDAASKAVPWWDGPKPEGRATGTLKQVDCLGRQFRLTIVRDDQKLVKLLVRDPGQVTVSGAGDLTLVCGPQKTRQATVEYFPKANAKLGTSGEVASIEFH